MPRRKPKKKKTPAKITTTAKAAPNVDKLVAQAQECLQRCQIEQAVTLFRRALEQRPNDNFILDLAGETLLQTGDVKTAFDLFKRSAEIAPTTGHSKWMYLAQMQGGKDAIGSFTRGLQILVLSKEEQTTQMAALQQTGDLKAQEAVVLKLRELSLEISNCYGAMGEVYTKDLCDEANAEQECDRFYQLAVSECNWNPEAFFGLANLRFIQQRIPESQAAMQTCVQLLAKIVDPVDPLLPDYPIRVNIAKLCMELGEFERTIPVLSRLLDEDDTFVESWYLLGICFLRTTSYSGAVECFTTARDQLHKLQKAGQLSPEEAPYLESIGELLQQATQLLANTPEEMGGGETPMDQDMAVEGEGEQGEVHMMT